jgi:NAD(P)-dependent dehydrogenase (short-subunit alcohol dehydrogenase family)
MDLGLTEKRALVLGSSSGMGRAIAERLAEEGASVFVTGRDSSRVQEVTTRIDAAGSAVADITDAEDRARLVETALWVLGGLDIFVGITGGGRPGRLVDAELEDIEHAYQRMLFPQLALIKALLPQLKESSSGRILVLTARSVLEATPELALSSVFRSGVVAAARSLAIELAPEVTVNVVVPGQFDTPALARFEAAAAAGAGKSEQELRTEHIAGIPMGRLGRPEEIGDLVAFLASPRAGYITGTTIRIDGGLTRGF